MIDRRGRAGWRRLFPGWLRHPFGLMLLRVRPLLAAVRKRAGGGTGLWREALPSELQFWDGYLGRKDCDWGPDDNYRFRVDPCAELQPWLRELIGEEAGDPVRILDVGAGPLTYLGKVWPGRKVEIVATDALAREYDHLLERHGLVPPVRTRHAEAERLGEQLGDGEFDLVFARNSLDHCYDLPAAILEMARMTRAGRWIVMQHHANEGRKMGYLGLHQWNFQMEGARVRIDNQIDRWWLDEIVAGVADVLSARVEARLITAVLRRRAKGAPEGEPPREPEEHVT